MPGLDWLTARPVAHRGLHDAANGVIENTASAFAAAIAGNYAIECDLRISADGEAMVYHDAALGRVASGGGSLAEMKAADLQRMPFKQTGERMLTLGELCDLVGGHVTLLLEMKSGFDGDRRLAMRVAEVLKKYAGPVAAMSFDPNQVAALRDLAPGLPRGIVAERWYTHEEWRQLSAGERRILGNLLHAFRTRPHFVAYSVRDLPAAAPLLARYVFGLPLLTWTVRDESDRRRARWANQMIFEGFRP
ncbi:MAG: glycerophosphodiester phosphodiesterase [Pseudomonadota bacterium]|nr:glycerophosphodiester phosphodiesterase [Pseudomonadota bacterium]